MVKTTIEVDEDLWRRFSLLVLRERGDRKKNEVIVEILRDYVEQKGLFVDDQQLESILRIEEEREAFLKIRDKLIHDPFYNGKYVAVFRGSVVGCDEEKGRLAETVYKKYGYVPIYIDKVAPGERSVEVPSPELAVP
jgi:predicted transcriptional regulator